MGNRLKKKTPPPPDPDILTPDKEAQVTVTEVVKDERTSKIIGAISLLITLFLFVSLTSYLFTWQEDQDKIHQLGVSIFSVDDVKVTNLLGVLGAFVAHILVYKGFGIASYLFGAFFFVLGVNLLFGKKIFSLFRTSKYVLVGLLILSMGLAFVARGSEFSWGGAVGELLTQWFVKWIGNVGTGALLALSVFSYIIWRFNPTFRLPEWKKSETAEAGTAMAIPLTEDDEQPVFQEWETDVPAEVVSDGDTPEAPISLNKMRNEGKNVVVIMPETTAPIADPLTDLEMVEDDETTDSTIIENHPVVQYPKKNVASPEPELEINKLPDKEEDIPVGAIGKLGSKYDVTLDLKDYKYPNLQSVGNSWQRKNCTRSAGAGNQ